jgi:pheromone shutdown protein TraB
MDKKKFKEIVGPQAEKIRKQELEKAAGSFRFLAELLLEWYERQLAEEEEKGDKSK